MGQLVTVLTLRQEQGDNVPLPKGLSPVVAAAVADPKFTNDGELPFYLNEAQAQLLAKDAAASAVDSEAQDLKDALAERPKKIYIHDATFANELEAIAMLIDPTARNKDGSIRATAKLRRYFDFTNPANSLTLAAEAMSEQGFGYHGDTGAAQFLDDMSRSFAGETVLPTHFDGMHGAHGRASIGRDSDPSGGVMFSRQDTSQVTAAFAAEVDAVLAGKRESSEPISVGQTPQIVAGAGAPPLPMVISPAVIEKAAGGKHELTADELKQLPAALQEPVFVFDSESEPGEMTVLTDIVHGGRNILVALHLSRRQGWTEVNRIASVYDKGTFAIQRWIENGLMRYADVEKGRGFFRSHRLQLPREVTAHGDSQVLDESGKVKGKFFFSTPGDGQTVAAIAGTLPQPNKVDLEDLRRRILEIFPGLANEVELQIGELGQIVREETGHADAHAGTARGIYVPGKLRTRVAPARDTQTRALVGIAVRAVLHGGDAEVARALSHEAAHAYFYSDAISDAERAELRAQFRHETLNRIGPLYDAEGNPRTHSAGATGENATFEEWFAERVSILNRQWMQQQLSERDENGRPTDRALNDAIDADEDAHPFVLLRAARHLRDFFKAAFDWFATRAERRAQRRGEDYSHTWQIFSDRYQRFLLDAGAEQSGSGSGTGGPPVAEGQASAKSPQPATAASDAPHTGEPPVPLSFSRDESQLELDYNTAPAPTARPWQDGFPKVTLMTNSHTLQNHPDFKAAKEKADTKAAMRVILAVAKEAKLLALARKHPNAIIVPVHAEERGGKNKLPIAFAKHISEVTGLELGTDVVQTSKAGRTRKGADYRMAVRSTFGGKVQSGRDYILVDDTMGMGGTLADLRDYIEGHGGNVVDMAALGTGRFGPLIALTPQTKLELIKKHGETETNEFLRKEQIHGGVLAALTEGEARWLIQAGSLVAAGNRLVAARLEAGLPRTPTDVSRRPSDTGNEGANLQSPRQAAAGGVSRQGVLFSRDGAGGDDDASRLPVRRTGIRAEMAAAEARRKIITKPEFMKWFGVEDYAEIYPGQSKVVDNHGYPLVVYHGTNAKFDTFAPERVLRSTDAGDFGVGSYATDSSSVAQHYYAGALSKDGNVLPLYLRIVNPLDLRKIQDEAARMIRGEKYGSTSDGSGLRWYVSELKRLLGPEAGEGVAAVWKPSGNSPEKFTALVKKAGYDGVIGRGMESTEYVFFEPNQAKSAVDNSGAFSRDNNSILYSRDGDTDGAPRPGAGAMRVMRALAERHKQEAAKLAELAQGEDTANRLLDELQIREQNGETLDPEDVIRGQEARELLEEIARRRTLVDRLRAESANAANSMEPAAALPSASAVSEGRASDAAAQNATADGQSNKPSPLGHDPNLARLNAIVEKEEAHLNGVVIPALTRRQDYDTNYTKKGLGPEFARERNTKELRHWSRAYKDSNAALQKAKAAVEDYRRARAEQLSRAVAKPQTDNGKKDVEIGRTTVRSPAHSAQGAARESSSPSGDGEAQGIVARPAGTGNPAGSMSHMQEAVMKSHPDYAAALAGDAEAAKRVVAAVKAIADAEAAGRAIAPAVGEPAPGSMDAVNQSDGSKTDGQKLAHDIIRHARNGRTEQAEALARRPALLDALTDTELRAFLDEVQAALKLIPGRNYTQSSPLLEARTAAQNELHDRQTRGYQPKPDIIHSQQDLFPAGAPVEANGVPVEGSQAVPAQDVAPRKESRNERIRSFMSRLLQREDLNIATQPTTPEQAKAAIDAFRGQELRNAETGIVASISTEQRNKMTSSAALGKSVANGFTPDQHNTVAARVNRLWFHAIQVESRADESGDVNIASIKRFIAPIVLDGSDANAYLTLKESVEHGHRIYSVELQEIETPLTQSGAPTAKAGDATSGETAAKIEQLRRAVKWHPATPNKLSWEDGQVFGDFSSSSFQSQEVAEAWRDWRAKRNAFQHFREQPAEGIDQDSLDAHARQLQAEADAAADRLAEKIAEEANASQELSEEERQQAEADAAAYALLIQAEEDAAAVAHQEEEAAAAVAHQEERDAAAEETRYIEDEEDAERHLTRTRKFAESLPVVAAIPRQVAVRKGCVRLKQKDNDGSLTVSSVKVQSNAGRYVALPAKFERITPQGVVRFFVAESRAHLEP